jgi:hypothetical protein
MSTQRSNDSNHVAHEPTIFELQDKLQSVCDQVKNVTGEVTLRPTDREMIGVMKAIDTETSYQATVTISKSPLETTYTVVSLSPNRKETTKQTLIETLDLAEEWLIADVKSGGV